MSGFITKSRDYRPKLVARDDGFFDVVVDRLVRQGRVSREMGERIVRAIAGPPESREQQDKQLVERAIGATALKLGEKPPTNAYRENLPLYTKKGPTSLATNTSRSRWYAKGR